MEQEKERGREKKMYLVDKLQKKEGKKVTASGSRICSADDEEEEEGGGKGKKEKVPAHA